MPTCSKRLIVIILWFFQLYIFLLNQFVYVSLSAWFWNENLCTYLIQCVPNRINMRSIFFLLKLMTIFFICVSQSLCELEKKEYTHTVYLLIEADAVGFCVYTIFFVYISIGIKKWKREEEDEKEVGSAHLLISQQTLNLYIYNITSKYRKVEHLPFQAFPIFFSACSSVRPFVCLLIFILFTIRSASMHKMVLFHS